MTNIETKKLHELQKLIETTNKQLINHGNHQHKTQLKLTQSDKIAFAYDFYNLMGDVSLLDILINIPKDNETLTRSIIKFIIKNKLLKPYPNTSQYTQTLSQSFFDQLKMHNLSVKTLISEYNHQNWLERFDETAIFEETKTKHPSYHIYLDSNNNPIKFDKDLSTKVKLAIIEQGIIPARCIVEGAYSYVAKGSFEEYVKTIKSKKGVKINGR